LQATSLVLVLSHAGKLTKKLKREGCKKCLEVIKNFPYLFRGFSMKKAFFISVIALSPLLLAVVPTAQSEQKAEVKGSEHAECAESTEGKEGAECKEGAELGPDGKPVPATTTPAAHETPEHPACGCGY
jgi:hypothetical protein